MAHNDQERPCRQQTFLVRSYEISIIVIIGANGVSLPKRPDELVGLSGVAAPAKDDCKPGRMR